jgi:uncharacterized membrane protein
MVSLGRTQMPKPPFPPSVWTILGPVLLLAAVSLLLAVFVRPGQKPPDDGWNGIFYSNPDDPALFVPKRYGVGYTLNFGNRWSWVVLVLIFAMLVGPLILSAAFMRHLPR